MSGWEVGCYQVIPFSEMMRRSKARHKNKDENFSLFTDTVDQIKNNLKIILTFVKKTVNLTIMREELLKYRFLNQLLPDSNQRTIVLITGARQTGKTTIAREKYAEMPYYNLDAIEYREGLKTISTFAWGKDIGEAVFDEAQKEPSIFEKIKYCFDEKNINFSVLLGSSQILLIKKIRETLSGRINIYELWPLLLSELFWNKNSKTVTTPLIQELLETDSIDDHFDKIPSIIMGLEKERRIKIQNYYLNWGGMPALISLNANERIKWLKDYEYTYLERDLSDLARLDDLAPFRKFQKLSALRSGNLLNYSEIARDASLSVDSSRRYLEYLALSYQVILLQPYYENLTSSIIKTPKLYWSDIGILRQLSNHWSEYDGRIYETMVVGEIFKTIRTLGMNIECYFYRTRSGMELDLLIKNQHGFIGIEIKKRNKVYHSDITVMKKVASALGKRWLGGIVVYNGDQCKKICDPAIWSIPSYRLFI
ncbi:MAG: ATP-binding protein [candidate division KSB1 bacterium]|nr:ATP-binding protein [candidate division KSB1 bacterium]